MVPPVNANGASYSGDTADALSRPDRGAVAGKAEVAGLDDDPAFADLVLIDVERQRACGSRELGVGAAARCREVGHVHVVARSDAGGGNHVLVAAADPVEGVAELVVLDVERMAAGDATGGPEHTLGIGGVDVDTGRDRV